MKRQSNFPEALCADEAVCFIADRHHVTPQQFLRHFLAGASSSGSEASIRLEQNEIEILKGLSGAVKGEPHALFPQPYFRACPDILPRVPGYSSRLGQTFYKLRRSL